MALVASTITTIETYLSDDSRPPAQMLCDLSEHLASLRFELETED